MRWLRCDAGASKPNPTELIRVGRRIVEVVAPDIADATEARASAEPVKSSTWIAADGSSHPHNAAHSHSATAPAALRSFETAVDGLLNHRKCAVDGFTQSRCPLCGRHLFGLPHVLPPRVAAC